MTSTEFAFEESESTGSRLEQTLSEVSSGIAGHEMRYAKALVNYALGKGRTQDPITERTINSFYEEFFSNPDLVDNKINTLFAGVAALDIENSTFLKYKSVMIKISDYLKKVSPETHKISLKKAIPKN